MPLQPQLPGFKVSRWTRMMTWVRGNPLSLLRGIAAVTATATALILSYAALNISEKANEIADQQTLIMRQENLPVFTVHWDWSSNDQSCQRAIVTNSGGPAQPIKIQSMAVAYVMADKQTARYVMPLWDYFSYDLTSGATTGDVGSAGCYQVDEQARFAKVEIEWNGKLPNGLSHAYRISNVNYVVQVTYWDIFGDGHVLLFSSYTPEIQVFGSMQSDGWLLSNRSSGNGSHTDLKFTDGITVEEVRGWMRENGLD